MGIIKRALRRTSRKLLGKLMPPAQSHQLVLNPHQLNAASELASCTDSSSGKRKLAASLQRKFRRSSSKDTAVAEALLLAVKNYLPPLQFHHIHGPHAQLSSNKCVARRTQSFCQALVFSNRVILPNERVYIKVLEIAKCWSGTIRFGFTAVDPATLACRMPKHACPDMTNAGHTWARALADEVVRRNSVIHFSYNKNGIIHYGINNQDCGVFHANVGTNQNLWFIVDIYGLTAAVELIDPRTNNAPNDVHNFAHPQEGPQAATMYKSTSAMDELFGVSSRYAGSNAAGRRKKLSRKHARHAALIQANWPLEGAYPTAADLLHMPYGQQLELAQRGATQLPNLNSVTLPSAQQNIYSPMPSLAAANQHQQQQQPTSAARRAEQAHDYHQIMSNTYSSGLSAYQPLRVVTGAPQALTSSVSMANIAATSSSRRRDAPTISQADLSHQLENMHLHERRMRKQAAAAAAAATAATSTSRGGPKSAATSTANNQTPVAAARKRQHLQPINSNQTNLKRTPETAGARDQLDKSASSSASSSATSTNHRIVSGKSTTLPATGSSSKATPTSCHASVKPKIRQSIKAQKVSATRDSNNDNSQQGKDCPICFERPINCVLYQCGHMCTCYECGVKQWKTQSRTCPICRTVIKDVIKTYLS